MHSGGTGHAAPAAGQKEPEHVATQIPYALFVAVCTFIGFVVGGFVLNPIAAWAAAMVVFVLGIIFLNEHLSIKTVFGISLILLAVMVIVQNQSKKRHFQDLMK